MATLDLDLDAKGRRAGELLVPWSSDRSAYGVVPSPVLALVGAPGPMLLLTAGNHGDEYEGQVALLRLWRMLEPDEIVGRIVLMPALNRPAVSAGARLSPLDGGNLNRSFGRGLPDATGAIASWLEREMIPRADLCIDLHSGGRSLVYEPSVFVQDVADEDVRARTVDAVAAFGAAVCLVKPRDPADPTMLGAAGRAGVPYLSTELGGAERLDRALVDLAVDGILRAAAALDMVEPPSPPPVRPAWFGVPAEAYVHAPAAGVFEALPSLGAHVEAGDVLGLVHSPERPEEPPREVRTRAAGRLVCVRPMARVEAGDCLGHLAVPLAA